MRSRPVHPWLEEDAPERVIEARVFVPGLLGAGIVLSIALVVSDLVAMLRSERRATRLKATRATLLARSVLGGLPADAAPGVPRRLAPRWVATLIGVACTTLGVYVLVGAFFNFWGGERGTLWSRDIAWLWALLSVAAFAFIVVGVSSLIVAVRRTDAPGVLAPLVLRTPMGRLPRRDRAPRRHTGARAELGEGQVSDR